MNSQQKKMSIIKIIRSSPIIILLLLVCGILLIDSSVFSPASILQILIQSSPTILLALPVMVWLISGNMDMSAAYGTSFYVVLLGNILSRSESLTLALSVTFAVAIAVGLFNGIMVGVFKMASFIVTLASMSILQGLILVITSSHSIVIDHPVMRILGAGKIFGIPVLLLYTLVITTLIWVIMKYTRFGANVYALGCNVHAAQVSGVNIVIQQIKIFIFSALFTSLTSVALAARVSLVSPSIGGTTFLLNAITACIIGGTVSTGGKGTVFGTVVGAIIVGIINFSMTALGVSNTMVSVVQGIIIISALAIDAYLEKIRKNLELSLHV